MLLCPSSGAGSNLGKKQGGFGLTSQMLVAPAALLAAARHSRTWEYQQLLTQKKQVDLCWLPAAQPDLMLPFEELWKQDAKSKLSAVCSVLPPIMILSHDHDHES